MGRPKQGWNLRPPRKERGERFYTVRFTGPDGKPHELSTAQEGETEAAGEAARLYAEAYAGRLKRKPRPRAVDGRPIGEIAASWLSDVGPTLDPKTEETYAKVYVNRHFVPFFKILSNITDEKISSYISERLQKVQAVTLRKELSALRSFLQWCEKTKILVDAPVVPSLPKRTVGTVTPGKQVVRTPVSPSEVERILEALPERAKIGGWPVRARFIVMYQTTLRPETLSALSVPEHYQKGGTHLTLPRGDDKARFGRRIPLSVAAREALDSVVPKKGLIFGDHKCKHDVKTAAAKVLRGRRAETFHPYDFRSAGITHLLELGGSLPGVQHLAGHKHVSTTAKYVEPSLRAAEDALLVAGRMGDAQLKVVK